MGNAMKVIAVVLFVILIYALGWAFTSFFVWLLSLLLHFEFTFKISTVVFLILVLLQWAFGRR